MAFDPTLLDELLSKSTLSAVDVVRLDDALAHDGPVSEAEALMLLEIERAPSMKDPRWKGVFIDAISQFAIHTALPHGYLTVDNADWLLRQVAPHGRVLTVNMFEMLTTLLMQARWVPDRMVSALLDEVCCAITFGDGPLGAVAGRQPGEILDRDSDIVRTILYGACAFDTQGMTRTEIEGILAIDRAGSSRPTPASWTDLVATALVDASLTASGWRGPGREAVLAPVCHSALVTTQVALVAQAERYSFITAEDEAIASLERQRHDIVTGDPIVPCTAAWLAYALERDQTRSPGQVAFRIWLAQHGALLAGELAPAPARSFESQAA